MEKGYFVSASLVCCDFNLKWKLRPGTQTMYDYGSLLTATYAALQNSAIYLDSLQSIGCSHGSAEKAYQHTSSFFPLLMEFLPLLPPALGVAGMELSASLV